MHVLILSANMGGGHNAAGRALACALEQRGVKTTIADGIGLASPWCSQQAEQIYYKALKMSPRLYGASIKTAARFSSPNVRSLPYVLSKINLSKVTSFIHNNNPDAILATHVFCGQMLTHLTKHDIIRQYTAGIVTDYGYTPFWNETKLNDYFLPHSKQVALFVAHGMDKAKLFPLGIPIIHTGLDDVQEAKRRQGIDPGKKHVVIAGGAIGMGKLPEIVRVLSGLLPEDAVISVVCASNETARRAITDCFGNTPRVRVLGYVNPLSDLMAAADLVISKAGGLTSAEIFSQRIPYITLYSIPPVETDNEIFFMEHSVAYQAKNARDAAEGALHLLYDAQAAASMVKAQAEHMPENAACAIAKHVINAADKRLHAG